MAEFNSSAFAAVDSFFVTDRKSRIEQGGEAATKVSNVSFKGSSSRARRLGVGATKPEVSSGAEATGKILNVGKKKRKRFDDDGDDDDGVVPPSLDNKEEDDEDDDVGRTGIAPDAKSKAEEDPAIEVQENNKKKTRGNKNKGKKERERKKQQDEEEEIAHKNTFIIDQGKKDEILGKESEGGKTEKTNHFDSDQDEKSSSNRRGKRRKVRSRQKNIYKDNRPLDEKPDYLVPGGYDYKGRPITPATKAKLVSKNVLPSDEKSSPSRNKVEAIAEEDIGATIIQQKTKAQKKKKHRSQKYKNLE